MLRVENICKRFNDKKILSNMSFLLKENEILGVSGVSGIGKSTLAKILVNIEEMDSGRVYYNNELILSNSFSIFQDEKRGKRIRKEIQYIFQNPYSSLDKKQRIGRILEESIQVHFSLTKTEVLNKINEFLNKCNLTKDILSKYPQELSGGQLQRINIIRALLLEPRILICDEITASLDVFTQNEILNLLLDLKDEYNLSYLFITHSSVILDKFCDAVIELK
mgnify:FL=1